METITLIVLKNYHKYIHKIIKMYYNTCVSFKAMNGIRL